MEEDIKYMKLAIKEAKSSLERGEIPVGAVLVSEKNVFKGGNKKESDQDAIAHAEIVVIKKANKFEKNWRLNDYTLYVTLEPCIMCTAAIVESRIKKVVYAAATRDLFEQRLTREILKEKKIEVVEGILIEEATNILDDFFKGRR